jgi:hypothetical protein
MKAATDETSFRSFRYDLILVTALVVTSSMMTFPQGAQASEPGSVEDMMSVEERLKSGVDTLTAEQRQFLSEWLRENYTRNPAKVVSQSVETAPDKSPQQPASNEAAVDEIERRSDLFTNSGIPVPVP